MSTLLLIAIVVLAVLSSVSGRGESKAHVDDKQVSSFLRYIHSTAGSTTATGPLLYKGGPTLLNTKSVATFWKGPKDIAFPSDLVAGVTDYLTNLGGSTAFKVAQQYMKPAGVPTHAFVGTYYKTDTNAPTVKNPSTSTIGAAVCSVLNAQSVIPDSSTLYSIFVPNWPTSYCAYHSSYSCLYTKTKVSTTIAFAYLPTISVAGSASGGCSAFYSDATTPKVNNLRCNTYSNQTQSVITSVQHELYEAITDPYPSSGWVSASGAEIGDLCQYTAPHQCNVNANNVKWQLQPMWSNAYNNNAGGCDQGLV